MKSDNLSIMKNNFVIKLVAFLYFTT
jgi:hypothetical protein